MDLLSGFFAPLMSIDGWAEVLVLMFLELALGVDNLVFIAITSDRLPENKKHIGRRLGLIAAMVMRCILLCCVVWIMSINVVLISLPFGVEESHTDLNVRDLVFLLGGIYLVFKGVSELLETHRDAKRGETTDDSIAASKKRIGLTQAIVTIMVMDIVFSLDSVITAAGLSGQLVVMIIAVIGAVSIMIIFADPISDFINRNFEIKTVALAFITLVGCELVLEAFHIEHVAGAPISTLLYGMMIFGFVVSMLIMLQRNAKERAGEDTVNEINPDTKE